MTTSEFAKYKAPQFERPIHKLPQVRAAESDDSEMPAENSATCWAKYQKIPRAKLIVLLVSLSSYGESYRPMSIAFNARSRNTGH